MPKFIPTTATIAVFLTLGACDDAPALPRIDNLAGDRSDVIVQACITESMEVGRLKSVAETVIVNQRLRTFKDSGTTRGVGELTFAFRGKDQYDKERDIQTSCAVQLDFGRGSDTPSARSVTCRCKRG